MKISWLPVNTWTVPRSISGVGIRQALFATVTLKRITIYVLRKITFHLSRSQFPNLKNEKDKGFSASNSDSDNCTVPEPLRVYKAHPYAVVHQETLVSHALSISDLLKQLTNILQSINTDSGPWPPFSREIQSPQIAYALSSIWLAICKITQAYKSGFPNGT